MKPLVFFGATLALGAAPALAAGRETRLLEGYAVAACLSGVEDERLAEQGRLWAETVVQRSAATAASLAAVASAVTTRVKKGGMPSARDERTPMKATPMPVAFCFDVADDPAVRAAVQAAARRRR